MDARALAVEGAFEFTPRTFPDDRGLFVSPHQHQAFLEAVGRPLFPVTQTNVSTSKRGVLRGVHYTRTPPGTAKYTCCVRGSAIDIVVDIRVGSPTYGRWDASLLDGNSFRSLYLPVGVGHAFIVLEEDTMMTYLLSEPYVPDHELAVDPLDPALGLPIPDDIEPIMSHRDLVAPTLAQAAAAGTLPDYAVCREIESGLSLPAG